MIATRLVPFLAVATAMSLSAMAAAPPAAQECEGGAEVGRLVDLWVSGCEGKDVCPLVRGQQTKVNVTFVPHVTVPRLRVAMHALLLGFPLPFHLSNENACAASGLRCPLAANRTQSYLAAVPVKHYYPAMQVAVKLQLTDPDAAVDVVCQKVQAQLV